MSILTSLRLRLIHKVITFCYFFYFSGNAVAFSVNSPTGTVTSDGYPIFSNVVTNVGNAYDNVTGTFVCPVSGLYLFTANIMISTFSASHVDVECDVQRNGTRVAAVKTFHGTSSGDATQTATSSVYLELTVGHVVTLADCSGWRYVYTDVQTSFNGALIVPV